MPRLAAAVVALAVAVLPATSRAHWCDDMWKSNFNVVVKPEKDVISAGEDLVVWVQNNMGYPFPATWSLTTDASVGGVAIADNGRPWMYEGKRNGWLLPGEKQRVTFRTSGGSLSVATVPFYVSFGPGAYPNNSGGDVVIRTSSGLAPGNLRDTGSSWWFGDFNDQALQLPAAAQTSYGDLGTGASRLMAYYTPVNSSEACTEYYPRPFPRLWGAGELALRARAGYDVGDLRTPLKATYDYYADWGTSCPSRADRKPTFQGFALFLLGYIGGESSWLGSVAGGSGANADMARAALYMSDGSSYQTEVRNNASSGDFWVSAVSAAALGVADGSAADSYIEQHLIPKVDWVPPHDDAGQGLFAANLVQLVAAARRGWQPDAAEMLDPASCASFYEGCGTPPPRAPNPPTISCSTPDDNGAIRVQWNQPSGATGYYLYWGPNPRGGGCTSPGGGSGCTYASGDASPSASLVRDFASGTALDPGQTWYFAVIATNAVGDSAYSNEASCTPRRRPIANLTCSPTSGQVPPTLVVHCDAGGSADPNGASDIVDYTFNVAGGTGASGSQSAADISFPGAGGYGITVTVRDSAGLTSTSSPPISISVTGTTTNNPPIPTVTPNRTAGTPGTSVTFTTTVNDESPGTVTYAWSFDDPSSSSNTSTEQSPTHTFDSVGTFDVTLVVTDDQGATGNYQVTVTITATPVNHAPDLSPARATPLTGASPLTVTFNSNDVSDPDGDSIVVSWNFGDGTTPTAMAPSTDPDITHVYTANSTTATFTAVLTGHDNGSPQFDGTPQQFTITVTPAGNRPPDCTSATVSPLTGVRPLTVTLDASGCTDPDGNPLTFAWTINFDMTRSFTSAAAKVDTVIDEAGTFPVALSTSDGRVSIQKRFSVEVTEGLPVVEGRAMGGCNCSSASDASLALGWILPVAALRLHRRRRPS